MNHPNTTYDDLQSLGIRSRVINNVNGLDMHILEAGYQSPERECVLLLHGFPELAFSWRRIMPALAKAGYHVVAPDQRGYGQTSGWDASYDGDLQACQMPGLVTDCLALINALGRTSVSAVVGHDFGSSVAAWCAMIRPDVFRAVVLMSAPFAGPPSLPRSPVAVQNTDGADIHAELAALTPARKHYQWYYSERQANDDMLHCSSGVSAFLRAYFHMKSADWPANRPFELTGFSAAELAKLPEYYVMRADRDMAQTVLEHAPGNSQAQACQWLTERDLEVYVSEYSRTGFQGGLNWYRCMTGEVYRQRLTLYANKTIDVPARFIGGACDWGIHQAPGVLRAMADRVCTQMDKVDLIDNAGHWVQQEQSDACAGSLLEFLQTVTTQ